MEARLLVLAGCENIVLRDSNGTVLEGYFEESAT
jgi:hypothetical protein